MTSVSGMDAAMRLVVDLDHVLSRGAGEHRDSVLWPVFFLVDDTALRYLAGEVTASGFLQAPGPVPNSGGLKVRWTHDISALAVPEDNVLVGFALLLSAGGLKAVEEPALQQAYQALAAQVQALALGLVAQSSRLGALLGAFGDGDVPDQAGRKKLLAILREGVTPDQLDDWIAPQMVHSMSGFRAVADLLGHVMPGATPARPALDGATISTAASREFGRDAVAAPEVPSGATAGPDGVPLDRPPMGATVQAWPLHDLRASGGLKIERPLPVPGMPRASLVLRGTLTLEV